LDDVVSSDIVGDARSIVVDLGSVSMLGRSLVSVRGWFDEEWAVACRTADLVALLCEAGIPGTA
jgi:glyceraldehyde-3-phosphate dehydrogenase/erythrose-4-phosphate dehydrogenase